MSRQISAAKTLALGSALGALLIGVTAIAAAPTAPHMAPIQAVPVPPSVSMPDPLAAAPAPPAPPAAPVPPKPAAEARAPLTEAEREAIRQAAREAREAAREASAAQREAMREAAEARREAMAAAAEARAEAFAHAAEARDHAFAAASHAMRGVPAEVRAALVSARATIEKAPGMRDADRREALSSIDKAIAGLDRRREPALR